MCATTHAHTEIGVKKNSYLSINPKRRVPVLGRNDTANSIFASFRRDLPHVFHWILEFLLRRTEGRSFLQAMGADTFDGFSTRGWLASTFDGREVERRGPSSAQGDIVCVGRMGSVGTSCRLVRRGWWVWGSRRSR